MAATGTWTAFTQERTLAATPSRRGGKGERKDQGTGDEAQAASEEGVLLSLPWTLQPSHHLRLGKFQAGEQSPLQFGKRLCLQIPLAQSRSLERFQSPAEILGPCGALDGLTQGLESRDGPLQLAGALASGAGEQRPGPLRLHEDEQKKSQGRSDRQSRRLPAQRKEAWTGPPRQGDEMEKRQPHQRDDGMVDQGGGHRELLYPIQKPDREQDTAHGGEIDAEQAQTDRSQGLGDRSGIDGAGRKRSGHRRRRAWVSRRRDASSDDDSSRRRQRLRGAAEDRGRRRGRPVRLRRSSTGT